MRFFSQFSILSSVDDRPMQVGTRVCATHVGNTRTDARARNRKQKNTRNRVRHYRRVCVRASSSSSSSVGRPHSVEGGVGGGDNRCNCGYPGQGSVGTAVVVVVVVVVVNARAAGWQTVSIRLVGLVFVARPPLVVFVVRSAVAVVRRVVRHSVRSPAYNTCTGNDVPPLSHIARYDDDDDDRHLCRPLSSCMSFCSRPTRPPSHAIVLPLSIFFSLLTCRGFRKKIHSIPVPVPAAAVSDSMRERR